MGGVGDTAVVAAAAAGVEDIPAPLSEELVIDERGGRDVSKGPLYVGNFEQNMRCVLPREKLTNLVCIEFCVYFTTDVSSIVYYRFSLFYDKN